MAARKSTSSVLQMGKSFAMYGKLGRFFFHDAGCRRAIDSAFLDFFLPARDF
jgi:hypothetical protein